MNQDKMKIEILEDGTIKTTNDQVSGPNHANAEAFLRQMAQMTDGKLTRTKTKPDLHQGHSHTQTHSH